jgi:subtilisin family serine protease
VVGDVVTARVPARELERIAQIPGVLRLQGARVAQFLHDLSMDRIRAAPVRAWDGQRWRGFTGEGVIVGIVDTGLDHRHGDFRRADGGTRVVGLWDQHLSGPHPPPTATDTFRYGHYCSPADIDANDCPHRDTNGHGTHVSGTAASNGLELGPDAVRRYTGVAPEADLLAVAVILTEDRLLEAVTWVVGRARDLGRPLVLNLSLGFTTGPRDGTAPFDRAMNALSGPGTVIVASTGNHGSNHHPWELLKHGTGQAALGPMSFSFDVPPYSPSQDCRLDVTVFEVWYPGQDRLTIGGRRPDGSAAAAAYGELVVDTGAVGRIIIENDFEPDPDNDDIPAWIAIDGCGAETPLTGEWHLEFPPDVAEAGRRYHFWMPLTRFGPAHLAGGPETPGALEKFGRVLLRASDPATVADLDATAEGWMAAMHVAVAAVLIPLLYRSSPSP